MNNIRVFILGTNCRHFVCTFYFVSFNAPLPDVFIRGLAAKGGSILITINRLSSYTFDQALQLWNEGFQGYALDMTFTLDQLLNRFGHDGLSASHSVVATVDGELAGFVLNGIATVGGKTISWNGGTGVSPKFRGQGIGSRLIEASLDVYRQNGVQTAYLECISTNEPAIALYRKTGFVVFDNLAVMQCTQFVADALRSEHLFNIRAVHPADVSKLWFYNGKAPWQSQWNRIGNAEAYIAYNQNHNAIGYVLFRRAYNQDGELKNILLYQCEVAPGHENPEEVLKSLLRSACDISRNDCMRMAFNLPESRQPLMELLTAAGFQTLTRQVHMCKSMDS